MMGYNLKDWLSTIYGFCAIINSDSGYIYIQSSVPCMDG